MTLSLIWMGVGFGLITASVLALGAVGLTLQFGVTNFVNFAYGEFLTIGAYLAFVFNKGLNLNIWLSMLIAGVLTAVVAYLFNVWVIQPFIRRKSQMIILLVVTIGMDLFLMNFVQAIFGPEFKQYQDSPGSILHIGPFLFTLQQIIIILISAAAMVALHVLLKYTKLGKAMRALSDNAELALISGIPTKRVTNYAWLLSGFLGGLAGVVLAINVNNFTPALGSEFLFIIFAAVIMGGIGRPYGAMLGALVIGLAMEVSATFMDSAYKTVVAFGILVIMLLFRPQGILPSRGRV
ncbi:branched-chain amino acid ABC transporter permease [Alicyclobacillus sp. ALC3]|uniref:branched-chain amino acid ABC transporter permease n=1 Tax=Alicyclobacillus sp. ALC3 TaxID=2796143 RepID=UPI0023783A27|nr:branched-chain amino acid ABC transporter permease [Alicyclobacillus sp. ALC3]WDL96035.1 branched-chain amino acid ABC transporter permease [Alicyclobacillus sp. ALC3]